MCFCSNNNQFLRNGFNNGLSVANAFGDGFNAINGLGNGYNNRNCCHHRHVVVCRCNTPTPQPIIPTPPTPVTANAVYANVLSTTVASGANIPVFLNNQAPSSSITVTNGAVNLTSAGTYLISYYVTGSGDGISASLNLTGTAVSSVITDYGTTTTLSKTLLLTVTSVPATLTLSNTGAGALTVLDAGITVVKIA